MEIKNYIDTMKEAISYAKVEGNVTAYNWNETLKEKTVVAFGLGKFFRDTYERLFRMVDVRFVCDNNREYWGGGIFNEEMYQSI